MFVNDKNTIGVNMLKNVKPLIAISALALITACGGGGGGGGATDSGYTGPSPTFNLQAAWNTYFQTNSTKNYAITGNVNGTNVGGNGITIIDFTQPVSVLIIDPASPFPGPSINLTNVGKVTIANNATIVANGSQSIISSSTEIYAESNGTFKMIKDMDENEQTIVTAFTGLPTQATSGGGGVFYSGTVFSSLGYTCGTEIATYSIAAESSSALIVTITTSQNTTNKAINNCTTQTFTSQSKYRLTASSFAPVSEAGSGSTATGSLTLTY